MTGATSRIRLPRAHAAVLVALYALLLLRVPGSAVHTDLAHDLFVAWRIDHAQAFPWSGRILAGTIHLGPAYYWLLALLLALGRGWFGTTLLLGALAALQIPLAYLLGKELHSRRAGLLWAAGLVVPSWSSLEWVFPGHNLLTPVMTLAFLLCTLRYVRTARFRYLAGMALAFVLALHAHPTAAGLAWVGMAALLWTWRAGGWRGGQVLLAAAVGALPLVPYVIWDAAHGFADLRAGADYLDGGQRTGHLAMLLPVLRATAVDGTAYWFDTLIGWPPWAAVAATAALSSCGALGLAGAAAALRQPPSRRLVLVAAAATFAILLSTVLIRNVTPYYMTTVLRVALAGVVAIGLASLGERVPAHAARASVLVLACGASLFCTIAGYRSMSRGAWPFGFFPLFDVVEARQPTEPLPLLPAAAMARSGRFLCGDAAPAVHGALARHLLYDYAIEMRLGCGRSDVAIGGVDPRRHHWLGLSRDMLATLGVAAERRIGSLGVVTAQPLAGSAPALPATPVYPPYIPQPTATAGAHRLHVRLAAGRHLAVSMLAYFVGAPAVSVTRDGRPLAVAAQDAVTRVYACAGCPAGSELELDIGTADFADVDVVTF